MLALLAGNPMITFGKVEDAGWVHQTLVRLGAITMWLTIFCATWKVWVPSVLVFVAMCAIATVQRVQHNVGEAEDESES